MFAIPPPCRECNGTGKKVTKGVFGRCPACRGSTYGPYLDPA